MAQEGFFNPGHVSDHLLYLLPSIALLGSAAMLLPHASAACIVPLPLLIILRLVMRVPVGPLGLRVNTMSYGKPFLVPKTWVLPLRTRFHPVITPH